MGSVKQLDGLAARTVWCRMRWVVLAGILVTSTLVVAEPAPLVELVERAHPGAAPQRVFLLGSDGKFDYLGQQGALEEAELGVLAMDLSRAVFERGPGPACDATGPSYTIKTTRGALAWEVPCSSAPHPSVQTLVDHIQKALYEELDHPPILVELVRYNQGARRVELTVEHDGVWHRGDAHGVLAAADRKEVQRLATERRFAPATSCPGAVGRELWTWPRRSCVVEGDALVALVEKLTTKGQPLLVSLERAINKGAFIPRILVFASGQYFANEVTGQLAPTELLAWKQQVAAARLQLVGSTGGGGRCVPQPSTYRLRTARGKVDHRSCESPPHPTVQRLEEQLQKLRERSPQRLRLLRVHVPSQRDELVLEDGTLIGDGVRKRIDPSNASSLAGQIMGTTFAATRDGDCAAPQTHHLVESAGHGHLLWSEPCETPDPSVRALEARVTVLRK